MVLITKEHEKEIWGFIGDRREGVKGPISIPHQLPTLDDDNGESADSWLQRKGEGGQKVDSGLATDSLGCGGRRVETNNSDCYLFTHESVA